MFLQQYAFRENVYTVAFNVTLALGIGEDIPTLPALDLKRTRGRKFLLVPLFSLGRWGCSIEGGSITNTLTFLTPCSGKAVSMFCSFQLEHLQRLQELLNK